MSAGAVVAIVGVGVALLAVLVPLLLTLSRSNPNSRTELTDTASRPQRRPTRRPVAWWCRPMLDRPDVLVVDVETTGFGPKAEVLAVAAIDTTGRVRLDTVSLPVGRIPRGASDVHGLTRACLRKLGARPWHDVHAELASLLRDAQAVIAWNADYDSRLLKQTAERHGLSLPSVPWHCAMRAEADYRGTGAAWAKLGDAAARLGVRAADAHSAVGDARTTLAVMRRLVEVARA